MVALILPVVMIFTVILVTVTNVVIWKFGFKKMGMGCLVYLILSGVATIAVALAPTPRSTRVVGSTTPTPAHGTPATHIVEATQPVAVATATPAEAAAMATPAEATTSATRQPVPTATATLAEATATATTAPLCGQALFDAMAKVSGETFAIKASSPGDYKLLSGSVEGGEIVLEYTYDVYSSHNTLNFKGHLSSDGCRIEGPWEQRLNGQLAYSGTGWWQAVADGFAGEWTITDGSGGGTWSLTRR